MKKILLVMSLLGCSLMAALAQTQERIMTNMPPGDNVVGKLTAVSKDALTVAPLMGGDPVTVKIGEATRIIKDRQPAKLEDFKADDVVFARGKLNGNVLEAAVVTQVNPEMIQRMHGDGAAGGGAMMAGFNREDIGKKFIVGEVKAIQETKLTIARPDGQTQDIEVDENTSFKKGTESVTLPDIKVGDFVRGRGEVKDNVFVPKELIVGRPQMQMKFMMGGPGAQPQEQKKPDGAAPSAATTPATPPATPPK
jgi:Domain of unknown function (DUF5666)